MEQNTVKIDGNDYVIADLPDIAKVAIEHKLSLSDIREQFIILCDNLNVDGILDPIRPY